MERAEPPRIISIQSQVLYGHVGNSAAGPVMAALGARVTAVPTALLSNHPHYPSMRGTILAPELLADLLRGIEERALIDDSSVIVTGFLGSVRNGEVVTDFIARWRQKHPRLRFICDPVLGDEDLGAFAPPGLMELFRDRLLPQAWLATPNRWEAEQLAGNASPPADLLQRVADLGPQHVIVTGGDFAEGTLSIRILDEGKHWEIRTPRIPTRPAGTGDLFTGAVAARVAQGASVREAARDATGIIYKVLERTGTADWSEMPLDTALANAVRNPALFTLQSIGEPA